MTKAREKIKISFDIKTFLVIVTTIGSISFWGATLVNKIDDVVVAQKETKEQIKDVYACQKESWWEVGLVRADCANDTQEDLTLKHNITKHGKPYSDYSDIDPFHNNIFYH